MKTITYNPETHKLVPLEPTHEMTRAMEREWLTGSTVDMAKREYQQMLNAAPAAEEAPGQEPDLSGLRPDTQEAIRGWLKDGTFVERAIGAMIDQEKELMGYEKQQPVASDSIQTWIGLTDDEVKHFQMVNCVYPGTTRAIEEKLREKNAKQQPAPQPTPELVQAARQALEALNTCVKAETISKAARTQEAISSLQNAPEGHT